MKRAIVHATFLAVIVGVVAASSALAGGSRLLQTNATLIRVGDWRVDRDPTLLGAVNAFSTPSSCREIVTASGSVVRWSKLGVRVTTATYGGVPEGFTSCSYGGMPVSHIIVSGRAWTTSLGLHVGDPVAKVRRLYPKARYQARGYGESYPGNSYFLVTYRTGCIGDCGNTRYTTAARLIAKMRAGRVVEFVLPVGAQGE